MLDKKCMIGVVLIVLAVTVGLTSAQGYYYKAVIEKDHEVIRIKRVNMIYSMDNPENPLNRDLFTVYNYVLYDSRGNVLVKEMFGLPDKEIFDEINETTGELIFGGFNVVNQTEHEITLPYREDARELVITDSNNIIKDRMIVSKFSRIGFNKSDYDNEKTGVTKSKDYQLTRPSEGTKESSQDEVLVVMLFLIILTTIVILALLIMRKKER